MHVTGNTAVDAVFENLRLAERKSRVLKDRGLEKGSFLLATFHRAENTDIKKNLKGIVEGIALVSRRFGLPAFAPLHPRTRARLTDFKIQMPREIAVIPPTGYMDFLVLMENARLILTDSGGVQEEACALHVPCVTLRENTERPETLAVGSNALAGTDPARILRAAQRMMRQGRRWRVPFGDGKAGEKIVKIIATKYR